MRMFIVHTRALAGCCKTGDAPLIVEVEGEIVTGLQDPSVMWLPKGEFLFKIVRPESLHETHDKVTTLPVYYSHSIFDSLDSARQKAELMITSGFEFELRKHQVSYTPEQVAEKIAGIQEVMLP